VALAAADGLCSGRWFEHLKPDSRRPNWGAPHRSRGYMFAIRKWEARVRMDEDGSAVSFATAPAVSLELRGKW